MAFLRHTLFLLLVALASLSARADNVLFFGNSFTFGAMAPWPCRKWRSAQAL